MSAAALVLFAMYLAVGLVLRTWLQWRRSVDGGFRGISGRPGSPEWLAGVAFVVALLAGLLGPVAALAASSRSRGWVRPGLPGPDWCWRRPA